MANALERVGRVLVAAGELRDLRVRPDEDKNDEDARASRQAYFINDVTTVVPVARLSINTKLTT